MRFCGARRRRVIVPTRRFAPTTPVEAGHIPGCVSASRSSLASAAVRAVVKMGDTESEIQEGLNAGIRSVGVSAIGNEVGMSAAKWEALRDNGHARLVAQACEKLGAAGAHYVIEQVALLEPVLEEIDARVAVGERP